MPLSTVLLRRPVAALLIAAAVVLLGCGAFARLPVAALPEVERPTVIVEAYLPGADADTIATALAQPLERQIGAISGIDEMTSFSANGGTQIVVQFGLEKGIDGAAGEVQAAIDAAKPDLPPDLPRPPTYFKANPSSLSAIVLALTSDIVPPGELFELADGVVSAKLGALPGVAQVQVSGGERRAVRIKASVQRLAAMGLSLSDVERAVAGASRNLPKGALSEGDKSWTVTADDQLIGAAAWRDLVVSLRDGAPVRLSDVADVGDGVLNDRALGWFGTERGVILFVRKQQGANVVQTVDAVKAALPELARWLPEAVKIHTVYDRTLLIRASVREVWITASVAVSLIVAAIVLFLRQWRAAAIPVLSIPVAMAGSAIAMQEFGYSLDDLSLMALVIVISFVVDDAIIIVERVTSMVEAGVSLFDAAASAPRRMGFTIVAISATLVASLVPVIFMPDVAGRYFREFGVTLAIGIATSAAVALTFVPVLCSHLVVAEARGVGRESAALRLYRKALSWCLDRPAVAIVAVCASLAGSAAVYAELPKGLLPTQDTGILRVQTVADASISFAAMARAQRAVADVVLSDPAVEALTSFIGGNGSAMSVGNLFVGLKPADRRPPIDAVVERLRNHLAGVGEVRALLTPQQDLDFGGQATPSRYQYTLVGPSLDELWDVADAMRRRMLALPEITDVITSAERSGLRAGLTVDRGRAAMLGVTPLAIDDALYDAFGQRLVGMIYRPTEFNRVVLEAGLTGPIDAAALEHIYVPGLRHDHLQIPLSEVVSQARAHAPIWIRHVDQFPAITLSFDTRPGVSIGAALSAIGRVEAGVRKPPGVHGGFRGEAAAAGRSGARDLLLVSMAVFAIYLILGILYESLLQPLVILSSVPSATLGGLAALRLTGTPMTLITSIASILLLGLVMKNSILVIDFALRERRRGQADPRVAILDAAVARARPILMTTFVAMLGALPLAVEGGPGCELRRPLGIILVGGLIGAQLLTSFTTPVLYVWMERLRSTVLARTARCGPAPASRPVQALRLQRPL